MEKVKQKEKTKDFFFFNSKNRKTPEKTTNKTEIIYQKEGSKH